MGKFPEPNLIEKAEGHLSRQSGNLRESLTHLAWVGPSLEALRLGCETYSNDLNPVAVLIQKCTLEYPQKYGKPERLKRVVEFGKKVSGKEKVKNVLLEDVKRWGDWVLQEAKKEIGRFYPRTPMAPSPLATSGRGQSCQNPTCGAAPPHAPIPTAKKDRRRLPYILM